jgi:predicted RecB family nuclease
MPTKPRRRDPARDGIAVWNKRPERGIFHFPAATTASETKDVEERVNMGKLITTEVAVAYTNCPRKAFLLLNTASPPPPHDYESICRARGEAHRQRHFAQVQRDCSEAVAYDQGSLDDGYQYVLGVDLRAGDLLASCDLLERLDRTSSSEGFPYFPQVVAGTFSVTDDLRFALSFAGHVLGLIRGSPPGYGKVITLDGIAHKVVLGHDDREVVSTLEAIRGMADRDSAAPPVILNRHCPLCPFRAECRVKAEADDDLSLLDRMTPKAIRRYHKKGIFTVTQLSYLFRPRRRRRGACASPVFKLELQALAIRTGKVCLQTPPGVVRKPVELFLDIEGIPDEQFHYLFGILVRRGDERTVHSLWADARVDESRNWGELRTLLDSAPDAPIIHCGSYEPRAIARIGQRYGTDIETYLRRMVNLNEEVFGRVYFPVRSNGLKDIGGFLGASWAEPGASGLQSIAWRHRWEEAHDAALKEKLVRYNQDDCWALVLLWDELVRLGGTAASADPGVDFADRPKQLASGAGTEVHAQFAAVLKSAHASYQNTRLTLSSGKSASAEEGPKKRGGKKGHQGFRRVLPTRADRTVTVPRKRICPRHRDEKLQPTGEVAEAFQIDLRLTRKGYKKIITKYIGSKMSCPKCSRSLPPPTISRLGGCLFGHGFQAWVVYQRVVLRLSYRLITATMEDMFCERTSEATVINFVRNLADYYGPCEKANLVKLLASPFLHADETRLSIQGIDHYVWILTDGRRVVFWMTATRETTVIRELLSDYEGVLVSDFYAGYDGVGRRQQKCLVHLIRDLNDDLWASPFDAEFEGFVLVVRDLLVPMIEAVQGRVAKARQLAKFLPTVDAFYASQITGISYKSEVTQKYQKRFERYRDSLFTFLSLDGIPWNNNTAERGIRHLAVQRKISGAFFEGPITNYLLLLGIAQTCRFQEKSFLKFLMSGGLDVDEFRSGKRLRFSKAVGSQPTPGGTEGFPSARSTEEGAKPKSRLRGLDPAK